MNRDLGIHSTPLAEESSADGWTEKRRDPRRQLGVRCWISDGRHTLYARIHDVSLGGLSIRAPVSFAPDAVLAMALVFTGDLGEASAELTIRARGRVVWVRAPGAEADADRAPGAPRMGAKFLEIIEGDQLLRRLVGRT